MKTKLTFEKAQDIRRLFNEERVPGKVIAHRYGVGKSTVSLIVNDKIWTGKGNRNAEGRSPQADR